MGVNTKSFDNASDMITFSRASGGYGLTKVSYGDELVTNGTFDSDTSGWTGKTPATISLSVDSGRLKVVSTDLYNGVYQDIATTVGRIYSFTRTVQGGTGTLRFRTFAGPIGGSIDLGGITTIDNGAGSTETFIFVATSTTTRIILQAWNTIANFWLDNISIKEVTYNSSAADATLQLAYHPNDVPRIEYNLDGSAKGLLVEESRTNLFTNSEIIDNTLNIIQQVSVSDVSITEGVYQGTWRNVTEDTSTGQHRLIGGSVVTIPAGSYATISCLVKRISGTRNVQMMIFTGGDNFLAAFDLDAETASVSKGGTGTAGTATIENLGSGVYRISANGIVSTTATNGSIIWRLTDGNSYSYTGDGTSAIAAIGMQVEVGSFPTSYMKTTGTTATRAADVASIPVSKFGYNQSSGSLVAQYEILGSGGNAWVVVATVVGGSTYYALALGNSGFKVRWQGGISGVNQWTLDTSTTTGRTSYKQAGTYTENNFTAVDDGGTVLTDTSGLVPENITRFDVGNQFGSYLNGHIKSIQYYPRRLTDAQIQRLTQPISTPTLSLTFDGQATSFTEDSIHG